MLISWLLDLAVQVKVGVPERTSQSLTIATSRLNGVWWVRPCFFARSEKALINCLVCAQEDQKGEELMVPIFLSPARVVYPLYYIDSLRLMTWLPFPCHIPWTHGDQAHVCLNKKDYGVFFEPGLFRGLLFLVHVRLSWAGFCWLHCVSSAWLFKCYSCHHVLLVRCRRMAGCCLARKLKPTSTRTDGLHIYCQVCKQNSIQPGSLSRLSLPS